MLRKYGPYAGVNVIDLTGYEGDFLVNPADAVEFSVVVRGKRRAVAKVEVRKDDGTLIVTEGQSSDVVPTGEVVVDRPYTRIKDAAVCVTLDVPEGTLLKF